MPLYEYECINCLMTVEIIHPILELDNKRRCEVCGGGLKRNLCPTLIQMDYPGYVCPISNRWIEGKAAHRENLKKHGCRIYEAGETEQVIKRKQEAEKEFEAKLDDSIGRTIQSMSAEKQQQLTRELESGASLGVERRGIQDGN